MDYVCVKCIIIYEQKHTHFSRERREKTQSDGAPSTWMVQLGEVSSSMSLHHFKTKYSEYRITNDNGRLITEARDVMLPGINLGDILITTLSQEVKNIYELFVFYFTLNLP